MNPLLAQPLPPFKPLPPGPIWEAGRPGYGVDEYRIGIQAFGRGAYPVPQVVVDAAREYLAPRAGNVPWAECIHVVCCLWARHLREQDYVDFEPVKSPACQTPAVS